MSENHRISSVLLSVILLVLLALTPEIAVGQNYHTPSKKAIGLYKDAKAKFAKKDYDKSLRIINKALNSDGRFVEALQLKGELGIILHDDEMAIEFFEKSLAADSTVYPANAIKLSKLYDKKGDFSASVNVLKWYCGLPDIKENSLKVANNLLKNAEFREYAVKHPVDFHPVNIGGNVNTDADEYINQILPDGSKIYFTRRLTEKDADGFRIESVYYSSIIDNQYFPAVPMDLNWNNNKRMGVVSISHDQKKMYFVGFDWLDSNGRGDIYVSEYKGSSWTTPQNLGKVVNTSTLESQPCISSDGKELYFTRYSRINETTDIYVSNWFGGEWTNPVALSAANSKGNEMSPFIHPDGKTLYFVSDGLPGMGGYDVFMCKRNAKGEWGDPVNLGYPLNTSGDEISFAVSSDGKTGYISSIRDDGFGGFDIYKFDLDAEDKPEEVESQCFILHDIRFELNSATLDESSYTEIDSIASYLIKNPKTKVEVSGFTDDSGDSEHNASLSLRRANAIKDALIARKIAAKRIVTVGYGENRPVVANNSDEHRAMNRRVEIRFY